MSNLPDGVTDLMCEQGTMSPRNRTEEEVISDHLEDALSGWQYEVFKSMMDCGYIEYPASIDEAEDAIQAAEVFISNIEKDHIVTRKSIMPKADEIWRTKI